MNTSHDLNALIERSKELYERTLKAALEPGHMGKVIAVEPDSEQYFVGRTSAEALLAARAALPGKLFHLMRVGYPTAHTVGGYGSRRR